jgi:carbonic anhydrase
LAVLERSRVTGLNYATALQRLRGNMERRAFLKGLGAIGVCPLCCGRSLVAEGSHWSYEGDTGPDRWSSLASENAACSAGSQQSPIDITLSTKANLPPFKVAWRKQGGTIVNNGHTIQLNVPPGGKLTVGDSQYELIQFHFLAPSEHLVAGKRFPMEVHFVHQKANSGDLGVVGVFFSEGAANQSFKQIADAFPNAVGTEAEASANANPQNLLPKSMSYWKYEGSLTTPPARLSIGWSAFIRLRWLRSTSRSSLHYNG